MDWKQQETNGLRKHIEQSQTRQDMINQLREENLKYAIQLKFYKELLAKYGIESVEEQAKDLGATDATLPSNH
jgi:tryptophan synthase alpha subunit